MSVPEADERILPHFAISEQGLRELEIWLGQETLQWGPWVYVGTSQIPFQNGWGNVGGDLQPLRFRLEVPAAKSVQSLQIEGEITGGTAGTVVCSLPKKYRPKKDGYAIGKYGTEAALSVAVWKFQTNGDLIFVGTVGGAGSDTTAIHKNVTNAIDWIEVVSGVDASAPNTEFAGQAAMLLSVLGSGTWWPIVLRVSQDGVNWSEYSFGYEQLATYAADVTFYDSGGNPMHEMFANGVTAHHLDASATFTLYDSGGNPIFQMTEGSTDLHLPTGGNVIFDL